MTASLLWLPKLLCSGIKQLSSCRKKSCWSVETPVPASGTKYSFVVRLIESLSCPEVLVILWTFPLTFELPFDERKNISSVFCVEVDGSSFSSCSWDIRNPISLYKGNCQVWLPRAARAKKYQMQIVQYCPNRIHGIKIWPHKIDSHCCPIDKVNETCTMTEPHDF